VKNFLSKELGLVGLVGLVAVLGLVWWNQTQVAQIEARFIDSQIHTVLEHKRAEVEKDLGAVYDEIRTISMLPSVRAIKGGNRKDGDEDVVKAGRFTAEGHQTVQQIYNTLASRVHVSEVYAVIEGIQGDKGEVPFFMYDTPVMNNAEVAAKKDETPNPDRPEESEVAEYAYFPEQIAAIRSAHPRFDFKSMDEVPAYVSPLMRTCDNDQYPSIKDGNVKETHGLLYSVPFYSEGGDLRGVISAIIRANTLEALLLGVPFVPITAQDLQEQKQAGWSLPEPARFILRNDKYKIQVQDRRSSSLVEDMAQGVANRNVFKVALGVHSDSPWALDYYLPEADIRASSAGQRQAFWLLLLVVGGALLTACVATLLFARLRSKLGAPAQTVWAAAHQIAEGDLTLQLSRESTGDAATLLSALRSTTENLSRIVQDIKQEADKLGGASSEIDSSITDLAHRTVGQADSLASAASTMRKLGETVQATAENTRTATELALQASQVAQQGGTMVGQVVQTMQGINDSSRRIADIIAVIDGIAFQTNILALNAAVEAARAGEQGRGFAVVASEVRSLAKRSADAAREIKDLINASVDRVEQGVNEVGRAGATMQEVVAAIERVNASVEKISNVSSEQIASISDVGQAVDHLDQVTHQNAALVERLSGTTHQLNRQAQALVGSVAVFKT